MHTSCCFFCRINTSTCHIGEYRVGLPKRSARSDQTLDDISILRHLLARMGCSVAAVARRFRLLTRWNSESCIKAPTPQVQHEQ
ncbi:hypothetical protein PHSY_000919 [Pseudozyma hubeiensis SY62]|uniref:Uncharacterized protein n=1 Tax=Pseudozyma hubeiensis (strain SY62) TaxID=1305764 RepID=R9NXL4_PSEHS|nr:hypothetical protein PHSY_000919 [Pseudozyma hubeiensis SY62]GAC93354.1 hypothetical protein PHSY_000919 [Pseudozyma hubeiensis SY62]